MIPDLYDHQKRILAEDKKRFGLFLGTGASKTRTALELAEGRTLVLCPKQQREDRTWQFESEKFGIVLDMTVMSKEDFKKVWHELPRFDTVIVDECHKFLGVDADTRQRGGVEIPKTSKIFEALYVYLSKYPPKRLYFCSATPVSKPLNLWAIATLYGQKWDYFQFRAKYYTAIRMGYRRVWIPKRDKETMDKLAKLVQVFGYTGGLSDFFDVPEQTHKTVKIDLTREQKVAAEEMITSEADPLVRRARLRTIENGVHYAKKLVIVDDKTSEMVDHTIIYPSNKIDYIIEKASEFPKLLVFANYTAQIKSIAKALRDEGYTVSELTGQTKDRTFIKKVDESPDPHIIVAQSSISSGWQFPSCHCTIFASKSWMFVDYEQGIGRILRSNHLKKNLYIHLVVDGGVDEDCHNAIMSGSDFQEKLTINY